MNEQQPVPKNEAKRLDALKELNILDSLPEPVYDSITRLAARICDTPIALISLVDKDRQWFKAKFGLQVHESPREISVCQYTIMGDEVFIVEDAQTDERFAQNPMVTGDMGLRFYAGFPIDDRIGHNLGTICVMDMRPRTLTREQVESLSDLSRIATSLLLSRKTSEHHDIYKKFFDLSIEMLCVAGTDAYFKILNPAFTRILGWSEEELKSRPFLDFVHEDDIENTLKEIDKLSEGMPTIAFRNRYRKKDGTYVWMHWNSMPDEKTGKLFAAASDITDVVEANRKLEQAIRHKDIFLSNMSHEIRTPMNAIRGFAELLQSTPLSEEQMDYLETIILASDNLLVLINDILDMARIQSGKIQLDIKPFSIAEIVDQVVRINWEKATAKQLKVDKHIDAALPPLVKGDPVRLTQILVNLVVNAIKFTKEGGINIRVNCLGKKNGKADISFAIEDTGIGIPEDKIERIFERFEQASMDTTREYGGTGLGLSIVKMLVEMHDGRIDVKSTVGQGSIFTIVIPYQLASGWAGGLHSKEQDGSMQNALEGMRILLAEDNEMNQKLVEKFMARNGALLEIAVNGREAVEMLKSREFDAVIMDLQMPVMDGYTATREIRGTLNKSIPIIACTAHSLVGEKQRCIKEGMNGYVSKPYTELELVDALLEALAASDGRADQGEDISNASRSFPGKVISDQLKALEDREGTAFVSSLMEIYNKRIPEDIERLESALRSGEHDVIRQTAHLVAGTLATLNFKTGFELAKKLEMDIVEGSLGEVESLCGELVHYLENSLEITRKYEKKDA